MRALSLAATLVQFLTPLALFATGTELGEVARENQEPHKVAITSEPGGPEDPLRAAPTPTADPRAAEEAEREVGLAINDERLLWQLPDPDQALELHAGKEAEARAGDKRSEAAVHRRVQEWVSPVKRSRRLRLTLSDALHRALGTSFNIRVESYNPAIETTRVVEAEAAFDATFFYNMNNNKQDRPSGSAIAGTQIQTFVAEGGIRQLLPTGMQVSTSLSNQRYSNNFQFQTLNPQYFSQFVVEFRQPLLRGFGLDYNRAQINVAKNNRRISDLAFRRQVRDTLLSTEDAYWRLAQTRRLVPISARLIAALQQIDQELYERRHFDVLQIQISETKARLEAAKSDHVRILNEVRNAEDRLIALMNDPTVDLAGEVEIIPVDPSDGRTPVIWPRERLVVDRVAEVQAALDHREELTEAKLQIDNAKVYVGVAKNDALPRFDLVFRYAVDGLGKSADSSFDEVTKNDFTEYYVGVELELPVGNRARRAAERRARLQHAQTIAGLERLFEQVILDINVAVRRLNTAFDVIQPNFASMEATEDRLVSIVVRAERKDWLQLNQELNSHQALATTRQTMLDSLASYNIAIVELEKSKGTLLEYDGVSITAEVDH
ncbi:MAG: TolC family protein [Planctomycetota bacterium]